MKQTKRLLVIGASLSLVLSACTLNGGMSEDSSNQTGGDKYAVSQEYWTANITMGGFFGANNNLTMTIQMKEASKDIGGGLIQNQNGNLHIKVADMAETYIKPLSDASYDIYLQNEGKWEKRNMPAAYLATLTATFSSFIHPWTYADFAYNAETHAYERASDTIAIDNVSVALKDISFKFEDGKLLSFAYSATSDGSEYSFLLTGSNWGSTTFAFPNVDEPSSSVDPSQPSSDPSQPSSDPSQPGSDPSSSTQDSDKIVLSETSIEMYVGQNHTLSATVKDDTATITWESSSEIALIERFDKTGKSINIKAEGVGTAIITATLSTGESASCTVTITRDPSEVVLIDTIAINPSSLSMKVGESKIVSAIISPTYATETNVIWTVDRKGVVDVQKLERDPLQCNITAVGTGTANIEVMARFGVEARCAVTVSSGEGGETTIEVTKVEINPTKMSMKVGESKEIVATISPENATQKQVSWSYDTTLLQLKPANDNPNKAIVTALKEGNATIVATAGKDKKAACQVTIEKDASGVINPTNIELSATELSLKVGEMGTLSATVSPADATNNKVTWSTDETMLRLSTSASNPNMVSFQALKEGRAVIQASIGEELTASCIVSISAASQGGEGGEGGEVVATDIILSQTSLSLKVGDEVNVRATVRPDNATEKTVTWEYDTTMLEVTPIRGDANFVTVKALKAGKGVLAATIGRTLRATCSVEVTSNEPAVVYPTSISISPETLSLGIGRSATLKATILPADATGQIRWDYNAEYIELTPSESDPNTVTVKALKAGDTRVSAMAGNGVIGSCSITIA